MKIQPYRYLPTSHPVWVVLSSEGDPTPRNQRTPWIFQRTFPSRRKAELAVKVFEAGGKFAEYREVLKKAEAVRP